MPLDRLGTLSLSNGQAVTNSYQSVRRAALAQEHSTRVDITSGSVREAWVLPAAGHEQAQRVEWLHWTDGEMNRCNETQLSQVQRRSSGQI